MSGGAEMCSTWVEWHLAEAMSRFGTVHADAAGVCTAGGSPYAHLAHAVCTRASLLCGVARFLTP